MKNLYKVLGVRETAKPETITRAYRRLVMGHHPDRGGDPGRFAEVRHAYEVLSDPVKRKRYDETGTCDTGPDRSESAAITFAVQAFDAVLAAVLAAVLRSGSVKHSDLVAQTAREIKAQIAQAEGQINSVRAVVEVLKQAIARLSGEPFRTHAEARLAGTIQSLADAETHLAVMRKALELVKSHKFRTDKAPETPYGHTPSGYASFFTKIT